MELELKHVVPYFPYGLKMAYRNRHGIFEPKGKLERISYFDGETHPVRLTLDNTDSEHIWMFKPILRPLIEFGDEEHVQKVNEFIGFFNWCPHYDEYFDVWFNRKSDIDRLILQAPQEIFNYFLANHFDVFDLIKKDLAIDVNTLSV